jgi:hypothetical protein
MPLLIHSLCLEETLMNRSKFAVVALILFSVSPAFAVPGLSITPGPLESGNMVWEVGVSPDLILAAGSTPLAVELGFRLTGAPLLSATNINPLEWDTPNPGLVIFGWEMTEDIDPGPGVNMKPVGLQENLATDEIFVAYGSTNFTTPGNKPFLKIVTQGPANGGSPMSTIEWLGAYIFDNGRISQATGPLTSANFDIYSGTATQVIPEPATLVIVMPLVALWALLFVRRRR